MSTVLYNLVTVTGPRADVARFRQDARRRVSAADRKYIDLPSVAFSFEALVRRLALRIPEEMVPGDSGRYIVYPSRTKDFDRWARAKDAIEVKNCEIHTLIQPLSRRFPSLCSVKSELCLDAGLIDSQFIVDGRSRAWSDPEERFDAQWKAAADARGIEVDDADQDDEGAGRRGDGHVGGSATHRDGSVRRVLSSRDARRRSPARRDHRHDPAKGRRRRSS